VKAIIRCGICTPESVLPLPCLAHVSGLAPEQDPPSLSLSLSESATSTIRSIHSRSISSVVRQCASLSPPPAYLITTLYTPVLSSISTRTARGGHTTLLSEPASLPPIYTTRLLSFTLPFPRPPQIAFRQLVLESSTGIARASYSYSQSPPSSSSPVSAQPCPALLETAPPGLPSLKRARHHVSTRHCYTNHRQPREYGPQRSQRQGDLPRRGLW
jgi:hypothetical protein